MGRKRSKTAKQERAVRLVASGLKRSVSEVYNLNPPDPPVALLALHPEGHFVAVAVDTHLRVFDRRENKLVTQDSLAAHTLPIRDIAFDATGRYLLSGGDDKGIRVWSTASWRLLHTMRLPKKVSAAAFSTCGTYVIGADKFGDVYVGLSKPSSDSTPPQATGSAASSDAATAQSASEQQAAAAATPVPAPKGPALLLGHFCSIVTSLALSPDGRFLVTTDRDHKVRVTLFPPDPFQGAHVIHSFCLGHTSFVKSSAFVSSGVTTRLVTGGGDGTVRLWDHETGKQLSQWDLPEPEAAEGAPAGEQAELGDVSEGGLHAAEDAEVAAVRAEEVQVLDSEPTGEAQPAPDANAAEQAAQGMDALMALDEGEEPEGDKEGLFEDEGLPVAYSVAASPDGRIVAVVIEGESEVALLDCDLAASSLSHRQQLQMPGGCVPTQLQFDATGALWLVAGPPSGAPAGVVVAVASCKPGSQCKAATTKAKGAPYCCEGVCL